ncbi:MAG: sensor histidine kinase [Bacteroidota bacterium]
MLESTNEIIWFLGLVVIVILCLLIFFLAIMVKNYRIRQKAESDIKDAIINTQENEQNRIAEDLHDDIGPMLSAIKLQVSALVDAEKDELNESLSTIDGYLNQAINSVRAVARNLSSQLILKFGLEQSLRDNISIVSSLKRVNINFDFKLKGYKLHASQEINFYRILREMLNNSVKHSNCENIRIALIYNDQSILLSYTDDGKTDSNGDSSKSMGQINIRNRVNLLNGVIKKFSDDFTVGANYEFVFPVVNSNL